MSVLDDIHPYITDRHNLLHTAAGALRSSEQEDVICRLNSSSPKFIEKYDNFVCWMGLVVSCMSLADRLPRRSIFSVCANRCLASRFKSCDSQCFNDEYDAERCMLMVEERPHFDGWQNRAIYAALLRTLS